MSPSEPPKKSASPSESERSETQDAPFPQDDPIKVGATDSQKPKKGKGAEKSNDKAKAKNKTDEESAIEAAETTPPPQEQKQSLRVPGGFVGLFILLLLAGGLGGYSALNWQSYLGLTPPLSGEGSASWQEEVSAIKKQLATLNREISQTQEALDALGKSAGDTQATQISDLQTTIEQLQTRLSGAEQGLAQMAQLPQQDAMGETPPPSLITGSQTQANEEALSEMETNLASLRTDLSSTQEDLNARILSLEEETNSEELASQLSSQITSQIATTASKSDLSALDTRLKVMESNAPPPDLNRILAGSASKQDLRPLDERLSALEAVRTDTAARQAALALALANLMRTADSGQPFSAELQALTNLAPETSGLERLREAAENGVMRQDVLTTRFDALGQALFDAERFANANSWWTRLLANFKSLITVRRTGNLEGDSVEAIVARTEMHLKDGNLKAATTEIRSLQGAPAETAAPWLKEAETRATLNDVSQNLSTQILGNLGQTGPQTKAQ